MLVFSNHFSSINDNDKSIIEKLVGVITKGMTDLEELDLLLADNYFSARINNLFDQLEVKSDQSELFESIRGICRAFFQYDKLTLILSTTNSRNEPSRTSQMRVRLTQLFVRSTSSAMPMKSIVSVI